MAKNRNDLMAKLTDMLVEIGLNLSRIEVYLKLFPTSRMVELTSMLYAGVVKFLQEVIAHFQRNAVRELPADVAVAVANPSCLLLTDYREDGVVADEAV